MYEWGGGRWRRACFLGWRDNREDLIKREAVNKLDSLWKDAKVDLYFVVPFFLFWFVVLFLLFSCPERRMSDGGE